MKKHMKMLFIIGMMMATAVSAFAQSVSAKSEVLFLMAEEPYCEIHYDYWDLAELVAASDTLKDDDAFYSLMDSFLDRGIDGFEDGTLYMDDPEQPAFLALIPHYASKEEAEDYGITDILLQFIVDDEDEIVVLFSMHTSVGWMDCIMEEQDISDFFASVAFLQHQNQVSPK